MQIADLIIRCITALGVIVAIVSLILSLRASKRQRQRQFEAMYVQRYWVLMDRLSLDAYRGIGGDELSDEDQRAILAYFRLCEDQLEVRQNSWISDSTWNIWSGGMLDQIRRWPYKHVWAWVDEEAKSKSRIDGSSAEFALLRALIAENKLGPINLRRPDRL